MPWPTSSWQCSPINRAIDTVITMLYCLGEDKAPTAVSSCWIMWARLCFLARNARCAQCAHQPGSVRARSQDGVGLARRVPRSPDSAAQLVPDLGRERWDSMVRVKYFYAVIENIFGYTPFLPRFCSSTSSSPVVMARSIQPRWVPGAWSRFPWMIILNTFQDWSDCPDAQTTSSKPSVVCQNTS